MTKRNLSIVGVLSAAFAVASAVLFGVVIGFDPAAGARMVERITSSAPSDASFLRWGALTDMLGYYLLPAGLIVAVRHRVPWPNDTVRDVSTAAGVAYATIGAIGAGILAAAAPPLIESGVPARLELELLARTVEGLWQWVESVPFVAWAAGMALAFRARASAWSWLFAVLGAGGVLVWFGRILGIEPVLIAGLVLWLGPFPLAFATIGSWATEEPELRGAQR